MPGGCGKCCESCTQCCFQSCLAMPSDRYEQADYAWADLEEVIKKIVWRELKDFPPAGLTLAERCRPLSKILTLEVDKATIQVEVAKDGVQISSSSATIGIPKAEDNIQVLFQSTFTNNTKNSQSYSFKTERQTTSFVEMSFQRGFTLGSCLDLEVKAPVCPGPGDAGMKGKLGCRLQWSFKRGEVTRKEDRASWCVDNNIMVSSNNTGTATLCIDERATTSDFSLKCVIKALDTQVPPTRTAQQSKVDPNQPSGGGSWVSRAFKSVSCIKGGGSHPRDHGGDMKVVVKDESEGSDEDEERKEPRLDDRDEVEERIEAEESERLNKETVGGTEHATENDTPPAPPPMKTLPKVVVLVKRKSSPEVIKVFRIALSNICKECPDFFTMPEKGKGSGVIFCELKGRCHAVYAIEQIVKLEECEFVQEGEPPPNETVSSREPLVGVDKTRYDSAGDQAQSTSSDQYRSTYTTRRTYYNY